MIIYTNASHRVVSPADGAAVIEIDDNGVFAGFGATRRLCYFYKPDGTFYPAVDLDTIALLERKQAETDNLNDTVNTLILSSLEGSSNV